MELFFLNAKSAVYNVSVWVLSKAVKYNSAKYCFSEGQSPWWFTVSGWLKRSAQQTVAAGLFSLYWLECEADSQRNCTNNRVHLEHRPRLLQVSNLNGADVLFSLGWFPHNMMDCIFLILFIFLIFLLILYVSQGVIEVESENVFKLAANALQVSAYNSMSYGCINWCHWNDILYISI